MSSGMLWFRWHHGTVTDPKFALIAKRAGCSLPDVIALWVFILERASESNERGAFGRLDFEAIDCHFGFDGGMTAVIHEEMSKRGLLDGDKVCRWEERQPKREDSSAARTREYRERHRASPCVTNVTNVTSVTPSTDPFQAPSTTLETGAPAAIPTAASLTPLDADFFAEQELTVPVTHGDAPVTHGDAREEESKEEDICPPSKKGSRFALDIPPDGWLEFCRRERPDLNPQLTFDTFKDHWKAKPGKAGVKLDWVATWRNWVRSPLSRPLQNPATASQFPRFK